MSLSGAEVDIVLFVFGECVHLKLSILDVGHFGFQCLDLNENRFPQVPTCFIVWGGALLIADRIHCEPEEFSTSRS